MSSEVWSSQWPVAEVASPPSRSGRLFGASLAIGLCACLFRIVTFREFQNAQFVHLAAAQAIRAGDWPIRDYTEGGAPLQELLSAAALALLGHSQFSELVLSVVLLGLAAAVTCWVTARLTGSIALGLFAAVQQILVLPRFYSYPKILIYPVLLLLGLAYLQRRSPRPLVGLGLWTAVAFLLRHDHGVYSAIGASAAVLIAHWRDGVGTLVRRGALYAAVVGCAIAPYLAYVQHYIGIAEYFRTGIEISEAEASNSAWMLPRLDPVRRGPLFVLRPRPAEHLAPIAVQWRAGLSDARRQEHERALDLRYPELRDDGRTWRYRVELPAIDAMRTLVDSPDVTDTGGFDRRTLELADPPRGLTLMLIATAIDRVAFGPPLVDLFTPANAAAIAWYAVWFLPPIALLLWLILHRYLEMPVAAGSALLLLVAITVPTVAGLVRTPTVARIPDGFGTEPIISAWVLAALWMARPRPAVLRVPLKALAMLLAPVLVVAAATMAAVPEQLRSTGVSGFGAVATRVQTVVDVTRRGPAEGSAPEYATTRLVRYVNRCTTTDDRLLVTWFAPEINFQTQRVFAGGVVSLALVLRPPSTYESAVIERLDHQRVPIVLSRSDEAPAFDAAYPRLVAYLADRYRDGGRISEDGVEYSVLVDRQRQPTGTDPQLHFPCFAP